MEDFFLIAPGEYFHPEMDFTGWEMNLLDNEAGAVFYAQTANLAYDAQTEVLSVRCAWAVSQKVDESPKRLSGAELELVLTLTDYLGVRYDSGGCHFESNPGAMVRLTLHPAGTAEKGIHQDFWRSVKAMGLSK
jgi:hypothetical protein